MKRSDILFTLKTAALFFVLAIIHRPPDLPAQTAPPLVSFQGRLTDNLNNPLDGGYALTFAVFPSATGGTALWTEAQAAVPVVNGTFNAKLGGVTPMPASLFAGADRYLEITVNGTALSPRQAFITVPYAFNAQLLDGRAASAFVSASAAQTIGGLKTFTSDIDMSGAAKVINLAAPLSGSDAATKDYVDGAVGGSPGYILSSTQTFTGLNTFLNQVGVSSDIYLSAGRINLQGNFVTTPAGLLDASKLANTVPGAALSGAYSNALTLGSASGGPIAFSTNVVVSAAQLRFGNFAGQPSTNAGAGAVYYDTGDGLLHYSNGSSWTPLAAGDASPWTGGGTGAVTLLAAGDKVGVGAAPSEKLHVDGNIRANYAVLAASAVFSGTGAAALTVGGGIKAGGVDIIGADGRIPALTAAYLADLGGADLTGLSASNMGAGTVSDAEFGYLAAVSSDIQAQLDSKAASLAVKTDTTTIAADLAAEQNSRASADGALSGRLDSVASDTATLNSLALHLAGAETVTGVKSFAANPVFGDSAIGQAKVAGLSTALAAKASAEDVSADTTTLKSLLDGKAVYLDVRTDTTTIAGNLAGKLSNNSTVPPGLIDLSTVAAALAGKLDSGAQAASVAGGVYTTGSYYDPAWLTGLATGKISLSTVTAALNGKLANDVTVPPALIDLSTVSAALAGKLANDATVPPALIDLSTVSAALAGKLANDVTVAPSLIDLSTVSAALAGKLSNTVTVSPGLIDLSTVTTALAGKLDTGAQAASVANGVYTTGAYYDPAWITGLATSKISLSTVTTALAGKLADDATVSPSLIDIPSSIIETSHRA